MDGLFARIAAAATPGPAVIAPAGTLAWHALREHAEQLARRLVPLPPGPIAVYGHKQPGMVVAFLAGLRLGRAYVPIDASTPAGRVERLLAVARPTAAVLIEPPPAAVTAHLAAHGTVAVRIGALGEDPSVVRLDAPLPPVAVGPDAPAYVLFTSGTTGDPKGVPVTQGALAHFVDWLLATHRFAPGGEVFLNQAPFAFDLSVMDLYGALTTGGTLFVLDRDDVADPRRLFRRLDRAPVTTWVSTPSFARLCLAEPTFARPMLPALRRFLFCGEALAPGVARRLLDRFPAATVWNLYGPTETTVAVTAVAIDRARAEGDAALPVGRPGPDVWVADAADPRCPVPAGTRGEIVIAGPQVAAGYLGAVADEDPARGPFVRLADGRRAYRTGDVGWVGADGLLYCAGRLDRQIKLHGHRIELEEIESHLRALPGVVDAAVLAIDRDGRPDHLVAFVVGADGVGTAAVRAALADRLPAYALPRFVHPVAALPSTSHGKVDRRALRELAG